MNHLSSGSSAATLFQPLSKTRRAGIAALTQSKRRRKERKFIVEGPKIVADILDRRVFTPLWLGVSEKSLPDFADRILSSWNIPVERVNLCTAADLKAISALSTPSEVVAVFSMPDSEDVSAVTKQLPPGRYLVLDGVQDPGNLGTIIRTAHWFGIHRIFASHDTVDIYNPKTIQSTMGSLGIVQVVYTDLIKLLADNPGIPAVGLQLNGENLFEAPLPSTAFICMGSEGKGLSPELQEALRYSYTIPPANDGNHPESLNVAIATAITLAQFCK